MYVNDTKQSKGNYNVHFYDTLLNYSKEILTMIISKVCKQKLTNEFAQLNKYAT